MKRIVAAVLVITVALAAGTWWYLHRERPATDLVLYGNVDLRQVRLAFNQSERIAEVLVEEGDRVSSGEVVARLDTSRLRPQFDEAQARVEAQRQVVTRLRNGSRAEEIAEAEAQLQAQQQIVERLRNGTRPEEIEKARAEVTSARADADNARQQFTRTETLFARKAATPEALDDARAASTAAQARFAVAEKTLELALIGPRAEDIAEAEARTAAAAARLKLVVEGPRKEEIAEAEALLAAADANLALLTQQLNDAELTAPGAAVVRTRLLEAGEMASPQRPAYALAILDPKWVRAYVVETELGRIRSGMPASITVDSFPRQVFDGWIGFISPVAEFTPKSVETEELRTSLVYEVRVFVRDPDDQLRLGMPATVRVPSKTRGNGDEKGPS